MTLAYRIYKNNTVCHVASFVEPVSPEYIYIYINKYITYNIYIVYNIYMYICGICQSDVGYAVAQVVEALRYMPKGRVFDHRCGQCDFFFN